MPVNMREGNAAKSDKYGYSYWSGKPCDKTHSLMLIPQSIADGWQGFCSCGKWIAFASFYDYRTRDELLDAIRQCHDEHKPR